MEEIKKVEQAPIEENDSVIEKAEKVNKALEENIKRQEELLRRQEEVYSKQLLAGKSNLGSQAQVEVESAKDYATRVMKGDIKTK